MGCHGSRPARGGTEVPCVCLQGASVGQGGLGGGSMPAVHSWHSQPAACSHRAGVGDDRDQRGALGVVPAPAPRLRAVGGGMRACGSTGGAHWLVSLALQGPVWFRCVRDAALSGGQGVAVASRDFWAGHRSTATPPACMAPQGPPVWILPLLGLLGITVPLTAPAIHTAGVPTTSDVCLASRGHGARLTQPGTTRDEGIALPAINISVRCGTVLAARPEPKDSEIQPTVITSRNEKLERSGRTSPWSVELDMVGWWWSHWRPQCQ